MGKINLDDFRLIEPVSFPDLGFYLSKIEYCDMGNPYRIALTDLRLKSLNEDQALEKAVQIMLKGYTYYDGSVSYEGFYKVDAGHVNVMKREEGGFKGKVVSGWGVTDPYLKFIYSSQKPEEIKRKSSKMYLGPVDLSRGHFIS